MNNLKCSFVRFFSLFAALVSFVTLVSCTFESKLTSLIPEIDQTNVNGELGLGSTGNLTNKGTLQSVQSSCVDPQVHLKSLKQDGTIEAKALVSSPVRAGKFILPLPEYLQGKIIVDGQKVGFVIEVQGCGVPYYRPVTDYKNQRVSFSSTLLTLTQEFVDRGAKPILGLNATEVERAIENLKLGESSSLKATLDQLEQQPSLRRDFTAIAQIQPDLVKTVSPTVYQVTAPTNLQEGTQFVATAQIQHWDMSYQAAYEWYLNEKFVGAGSTLNYAPQKNEQGTRSLKVKIGKDNGSGRIDSGKPFRTAQLQVQIEDQFVATAPSLNLIGSVIRNSARVDFNINTGTDFENCESFSSMAISGDFLVPPLLDSEYSIKCEQSVMQSQTYMLSGGDGSKVIALWVRDSSGNVSMSSSYINVTLDQIPPELNLSVASNIAAGASAPVQFTASDVTSALVQLDLEIALDGINFSPLVSLLNTSSPFNMTVPSGNHAGAKLRLIATDGAGNTTAVKSSSFEIDADAPNLTQTSRVSGDLSSQNSVTFGGACESGQVIQVSGEDSATTSCVNGAWSYATESQTSDASYTYTFTQRDVSGNASSVTASWVRDKTGPNLTQNVRITGAKSKLDSVSFGGNCESGLAITVTGADSASVSCVGGSWSYTTSSKSNDGIYQYGFSQSDSVGNVTELNLSWERDTQLPNITQTRFSSLASNTSTVAMGGDCEAGIRVIVTGAETGDVSCEAGIWVFNTNKAQDDSYVYHFSQTDTAGNIQSISTTWVRDTGVPIFNQTSFTDGTHTNGDSVVFGGACEIGINVEISGADSATINCSNGTWSFTTPAKVTDQAYIYSLSQTDIAGNQAHLILTWERDTNPPVLVILSPSAGTAAQSSLTVTGECETGRNLLFGGAGILSPFAVTCSGGTFTQTLFYSAGDGTKTISFTQTDVAGNTTTVSRDFLRDTVGPTLTQTTLPSIAYSNNNTVTFGGACETGRSISVSDADTSTTTCSGGTWSYTTNAKLIDGTYNYTFTQSDSAGNLTSISTQFLRDTVAPTLTRTTTNPVINAANSANWSGACETGYSIQISGAATSTISCSGGVWSYTASGTISGTYDYVLTQVDSAGNSSSINVQWVRDTTIPNIQLGSGQNASIKNAINTMTWSGTCQTGLNIVISGADSQTIGCPAGTWSYSTPAQSTDGARTYTLTQTNTIPLSSSITLNWTRDTQAPTLSSLSINNGASTASSRTVKISLQATDSQSNITDLCLKMGSTVRPTSSDSCWIPLSSPSIGLNPAQTVSITNYGYGLDIADDTYVVYSWARDEVGNISFLSSSGFGTPNVDKATIQLVSSKPATIEWITIANTNNPSVPVLSSEQVVGANQSVYIKWKITDTQSLPNGSVKLFFTTNEADNSASAWTDLTSSGGFNNSTNGGCAISGDGTGCAVFNAPTAGYFRVQLRVVNGGGLESRSMAPPLNAAPFSVLAGNTESGIGGSGKSAVFQNDVSGNARFAERQTLVVTNNGDIYFRDYTKGILKVNGTDGKVTLFIRTTGSSTGDGGNAVNATLTQPLYIALDYQNRLLIFDNDRIRRVNLNLTLPTIETIIGGGSDESDSITNPLSLKIYSPASAVGIYNDRNSRNRNFLVVAPNGDIYFRSDYLYWTGDMTKERRIRIYRATSGQIQSLRFAGVGNSNAPSLDLTTCPSNNWGFAFNISTGALEHLRVLTTGWYNAGSLTCFQGGGADLTVGDIYTRLNPLTGVSEGPHYNSGLQDRTYVTNTGMDGKIYVVNRENGRIIRFDHDPTTTTAGVAVTVAGVSGSPGYCADGTIATSCQITPQSIFVNQQGQVFFTEQGLIRTIASDGKVKTIYGQTFFHGDGGPAREARFALAQSLDYHVNGGNKIVFFDGAMKRIREFTVGGNITTIAGNGSVADAATNVLAANQGLPGNSSLIRDYITVDRTTGDVYALMATSVIGKLNRATGFWERLFGGGGTFYSSNDGGLGINSAVDFPNVFGYSNGKLLIGAISNSLTPGYQRTPMFKQIDTVSGVQTHLAGIVQDPYTGEFCADGTPSASCVVPMDIGGGMMSYTYDSANSRWLFTYAGSATIFSMGFGQNKQSVFQADRTIESFAYNPATGTYYYCGVDGQLYKKTTVETHLSFPNSSISCKGNSLIYDSSRNVIIFPFVQNGLWGIGEYAVP